MNFALTATQAAIQAAARAFAQDEVAPLAREADETGVFPAPLIPRMGALGFLGGSWTQAYGGGDWDALSYALLLEELGRADSSVRGFVTVHSGLVGGCIAQ